MSVIKERVQYPPDDEGFAWRIKMDNVIEQLKIRKDDYISSSHDSEDEESKIHQGVTMETNSIVTSQKPSEEIKEQNQEIKNKG